MKPPNGLRKNGSAERICTNQGQRNANTDKSNNLEGVLTDSANICLNEKKTKCCRSGDNQRVSSAFLSNYILTNVISN